MKRIIEALARRMPEFQTADWRGILRRPDRGLAGRSAQKLKHRVKPLPILLSKLTCCGLQGRGPRPWRQALVVLLCAFSTQAQHAHINAAATNQIQGTPLYFQNGATFVTNSGFAQPLVLATNGPYAGHYEGAVSFTAIGGGGFLNPLAPGSQARLRFVSVTGPAGGSLGIWDVPGLNPDGEESTSLTFSVPVGITNGTNSILLSENNGEPGADPGGHIHGRHYSATLPGLYTVGVQIYDGSTNGAGGGPIHTPSDIYPFYFQAGVSIAWLAWNTNEVGVTFATRTGSSYYLEATTDLATNAWDAVAGPLVGNNRLQMVADPRANANERFYRLRVTTP